MSQLKNIIQIPLITSASEDKVREKAKSIEGMQILVILIDLRCKHLVEVWRDRNIEDLVVSISYIFYLLKFV